MDPPKKHGWTHGASKYFSICAAIVLNSLQAVDNSAMNKAPGCDYGNGNKYVVMYDTYTR